MTSSSLPDFSFSFVDCKSASEETLKSNLASLGPKRDQKKADGFVCTHFEHVRRKEG